jgi:hypothetical protein
MNRAERVAMVDRDRADLSVRRQCASGPLLGVRTGPAPITFLLHRKFAETQSLFG